MSDAQIGSLLAILVGFCTAGFFASLYAAAADRPVSFKLLLVGDFSVAFTVPLVAVAGPAIIIRNTIRGRRHERRHILFVAAATAIASWWSMALGHLVMKAMALFV